MKFEEWWAKQIENFDPEEIGLMQLARVTWHAAKEDMRKGCAAAVAKAELDYGEYYTRENGVKAVRECDNE